RARHSRGRGRARSGSARPRAAVGRGHRPERGAVPRCRRARQSAPPRARGVIVALYGIRGRVGSVLAPALEAARHEVRDAPPEGADAAVDFTRPDAVVFNVAACLGAGVPVVVGTSGLDEPHVDSLAREAGLPVFFAPNFALGAVLMMRFAEEAARVF